MTNFTWFVCRTKPGARIFNQIHHHGSHGAVPTPEDSAKCKLRKTLSPTCKCVVVESIDIDRNHGGKVLRHTMRCYRSRPRCQYYAYVAPKNTDQKYVTQNNSAAQETQQPKNKMTKTAQLAWSYAYRLQFATILQNYDVGSHPSPTPRQRRSRFPPSSRRFHSRTTRWLTCHFPATGFQHIL